MSNSKKSGHFSKRIEFNAKLNSFVKILLKLLKKLINSGEFSFTESPACDAKGNIFTDH